MATVIDVDEVGGVLAELYDRVVAGEEIVLVRTGGPRFKIVLVDAADDDRPPHADV